jgi:hypothetical protein
MGSVCSDRLCSSSASLECDEVGSDTLEAFECVETWRGSSGRGRGSIRGTMADWRRVYVTASETWCR